MFTSRIVCLFIHVKQGEVELCFMKVSGFEGSIESKLQSMFQLFELSFNDKGLPFPTTSIRELRGSPIYFQTEKNERKVFSKHL